MAYCANCGHQISDYAQACPSCAHPRVATPVAEPGPGPQAWPGAALGLPQHGPNSLAEPGRRLIARIIDTVIVAIAFTIVFVGLLVAAGGLSDVDEGLGVFTVLSLFVVFGGLVLYEVALTATRGQTLGKSAMGICVVDIATGEPPGWGPSFVRWVVPLAMGFVPFLPFVDQLWLLWDANRQCLHDKAAKTLVINLR